MAINQWVIPDNNSQFVVRVYISYHNICLPFANKTILFFLVNICFVCNTATPTNITDANTDVAETFGDYISKFTQFGDYISKFGQISK